MTTSSYSAHSAPSKTPLHKDLQHAPMLLRHLITLRPRLQQVLKAINGRGQHGGKALKVRPVGRARVALRRGDQLGALETLSQGLGFLPRQHAFQARHVFLRLVLDVLVQVGHEAVEEGGEGVGGGGKGLQLVEVFFYLRG